MQTALTEAVSFNSRLREEATSTRLSGVPASRSEFQLTPP